MESSYTLETSVFQLVAYKKCKMAVKAHTLFYKRTDGTMASALCYLCSLCSYVYAVSGTRATALKAQNKVCYSICQIRYIFPISPTRDASLPLVLAPFLQRGLNFEAQMMRFISISRCSKLFYTISRCHFHIESTFSRRICPLRPRSHSPLCSLTRRKHLRPDNALSM